MTFFYEFLNKIVSLRPSGAEITFFVFNIEGAIVLKYTYTLLILLLVIKRKSNVQVHGRPARNGGVGEAACARSCALILCTLNVSRLKNL